MRHSKRTRRQTDWHRGNGSTNIPSVFERTTRDGLILLVCECDLGGWIQRVVLSDHPDHNSVARTNFLGRVVTVVNVAQGDCASFARGFLVEKHFG